MAGPRILLRTLVGRVVEMPCSAAHDQWLGRGYTFDSEADELAYASWRKGADDAPGESPALELPALDKMPPELSPSSEVHEGGRSGGRCVGTTKLGRRCRSKATVGEFCRTHAEV